MKQSMPPKRKRKPRDKSAIPSRDNRAFVNQSQHDTQQRQTQAQRRRTVAGLYHAGRTQMEIADELSIAQSTVSEDLKYLREKWTQQAATIVGEWVERELAYAVEQRASVQAQWFATHNARVGALLLMWSKRISQLLGLDAPSKSDDWSNKDWQEYVREHGLNEADVVAEAERIIQGHAAIHQSDVPASGAAISADETPLSFKVVETVAIRASVGVARAADGSETDI